MFKLKRLIDRIVIALAVSMSKKNIKRYSAMAAITGDYVSIRAALQGRFEVLELEALEQKVFKHLRTRKVCLDVGANIGNHSVFFTQFFDKVYALEPSPIALDILNVNAKWYPKIEVLPYGASDKVEVVEASFLAENIGATRIINNDIVVGQKVVSFECRPIDDLLPKDLHRDVGFIKIDVEGYEYQALLGCKDVISNSMPVIAFEMLKSEFDKNAARITSLLMSLGYIKLLAFKGGKFIQITKIERRSYKMIIAMPPNTDD